MPIEARSMSMGSMTVDEGSATSVTLSLSLPLSHSNGMDCFGGAAGSVINGCMSTHKIKWANESPRNMKPNWWTAHAARPRTFPTHRLIMSTCILRWQHLHPKITISIHSCQKHGLQRDSWSFDCRRGRGGWKGVREPEMHRR